MMLGNVWICLDIAWSSNKAIFFSAVFSSVEAIFLHAASRNSELPVISKLLWKICRAHDYSTEGSQKLKHTGPWFAFNDLVMGHHHAFLHIRERSCKQVYPQWTRLANLCQNVLRTNHNFLAMTCRSASPGAIIPTTATCSFVGNRRFLSANQPDMSNS